MDVDYLKKCGKIVTFKNGEAICHEGETGHSMYVLLKGMVEITIDSFSDMPKSLGLVSEGSFFGEMSLLEKKPRSATIISRSDDCVALEVSEDDFSMLLLHATSITFRLLLSLNSRLNDIQSLDGALGYFNLSHIPSPSGIVTAHPAMWAEAQSRRAPAWTCPAGC